MVGGSCDPPLPITTTLIRRLLGLPVARSGWANSILSGTVAPSASTRVASGSPDALCKDAAATTSASPSQGGKDPTQQEKAKAFVAARYWARPIEFVRATLNLRLAFLNQCGESEQRTARVGSRTESGAPQFRPEMRLNHSSAASIPGSWPIP